MGIIFLLLSKGCTALKFVTLCHYLSILLGFTKYHQTPILLVIICQIHSSHFFFVVRLCSSWVVSWIIVKFFVLTSLSKYHKSRRQFSSNLLLFAYLPYVVALLSWCTGDDSNCERGNAGQNGRVFDFILISFIFLLMSIGLGLVCWTTFSDRRKIARNRKRGDERQPGSDIRPIVST